MSRINELFKNKERDILSIYFTAGYPEADSTYTVLKSLQDAGADLVEIGMPFSDPLADGPVIQESSQQALKNGMDIKTLFSQLKSCRENIHIPILLMGYLNPVMQFGVTAFLEQCKATGVDGLILPDLPLDEYETDYKTLFEQYGIDLVFLVTPETSEERLKRIDALSNGFIYAVSSSSTTGTDKDWKKQEDYFKKLQNNRLKSPILVGFGIKDKTTFDAACKYTRGAIIGTAFIRALSQSKNIPEATRSFIQKVIGT